MVTGLSITAQICKGSGILLRLAIPEDRCSEAMDSETSTEKSTGTYSYISDKLQVHGRLPQLNHPVYLYYCTYDKDTSPVD